MNKFNIFVIKKFFKDKSRARKAMLLLSSREFLILSAQYDSIDGLITKKFLGSILQVTEERIRQIEKEALKKLAINKLI